MERAGRSVTAQRQLSYLDYANPRRRVDQRENIEASRTSSGDVVSRTGQIRQVQAPRRFKVT